MQYKWFWSTVKFIGAGNMQKISVKDSIEKWWAKCGNIY